MIRLATLLRIWLPFAVGISGLCTLTYVNVQQSIRQAGDDPQIQMAEDAAVALDGGATVDSILSVKQVDMARSLAPFLILYNEAGAPVAGSGLLNGKLPVYPAEALQASTKTGQNRVTWQPSEQIRIASVVVPYKGGFVMAGRNLREVESRESQTETFATLLWLMTLGGTFVVIWFGEHMLARSALAGQ